MKTPIDSSDILSNPDLLRQRFADRGYLFFKHLLDPEKISNLRVRFIAELKKVGWATNEANYDRITPTNEVFLPGAENYHKAMAAMQQIEEMHELAFEPAILACCSAVLGELVIPHPRKMTRLTYPVALEPNSTIPPHQDIRYCQGSTDTITTWIPLGACDRSAGGLKLLQYSHKKGVLPIAATGRNRCGVVFTDAENPDWIATDYEVGDLIMFHSLTVHSGSDNVTDGFRISVDFRYQAVGEPICECQMQPPFFPAVSAWEELTRNWSNKKLIEIPSTMEISPFRATLDVNHSTESRFALSSVS